MNQLMRKTTVYGENGFTLVEVMVAGAIAAIIVIAAFTILITSNKATKVNEQTADTQQNVRLAMDLISQEIKLAGFNMTGTIGNCTVGNPPQSVPMVPLDNTPGGGVGTINDTGPDSIRLVLPSFTSGNAGGIPVLSAPVSPGPGGASTITLSAVDVTAMTAAGMANGSVISVGGSHPSRVTNIAATVLTLEKPIPPNSQSPVSFPTGTPVYLLQCVTYAISNVAATCGGSDTCLTRNGVPMVDGIEDLQIAYGCDGCNIVAPNPPMPNGVIDEQDGSGGTFTQGDLITNSSWTLTPMTPDKIRLVQVTVVARQPQVDQGLSESSSKGTYTQGPVIVSDHNPSTDAGYNATSYGQQRRRVLTRTIQVRNFES